jgi:uncharacterized protein YbaA (DUF1428 family)
MSYVDGFVIPVPRDKKAAYRKMAKLGVEIFTDHGATRVVECWGDEITPGKVTGFDKAVKLKDDEVVVFSWIEWPDKRVRNQGMKKAMSDPRWEAIDPENLPFDGKRMIYGGYRVLVSS